MKALRLGIASCLLGACAETNLSSAGPNADADAAVSDAGAPIDAERGDGGEDAAPPPTDVDVVADIATPTTWRKATRYHLKAKPGETPYILVRSGATLTIEPGTQILGGPGSALVVTRGSRIVARGTAEHPVVFTQDVAPGAREAGRWGGLVLLGAAHCWRNPGEVRFEALPSSLGRTAFYGGYDDDDDSGVLEYVRIEFPGESYAPDKPFAGLTLAGVGLKTQIDSVQVHRGAGDGFSLVAGQFRFKHFVSTSNRDDGIAVDDAWAGVAQFVIIQQGESTSADSHGYEVHRSEEVPLNKVPFTIYNGTIVGHKGASGSSFAAWLGPWSRALFVNHVFLNFSTSSLQILGADRNEHWADGTLGITSSIFHNNGSGSSSFVDTNPDFDEGSQVLGVAPPAANREVDPLLVAPLELTLPNFKPSTGSPVFVGFTHTENFPPPFLDYTVNYIGAMGERDWTAGWTAYPVN